MGASLCFRNDNGKPTINPDNKLLAAPGPAHKMSHQQRQARQPSNQNNGQPQQMSHMVPSNIQLQQPKGDKQCATGETIVGQSPSLPSSQECQQHCCGERKRAGW